MARPFACPQKLPVPKIPNMGDYAYRLHPAFSYCMIP